MAERNLSDGELYTIRFRLDGDSDRVAQLVDMLHSMDNIDRVVEVGTETPHMQEDSSSAGLSDDIGGDFHDVEIHALDQDAADLAHDRVEVAARDLGVVVEFVDRF